MPWLGRRTDRSQGMVYQYANGTRRPTIEWLRAAWAVLRGGAS